MGVELTLQMIESDLTDFSLVTKGCVVIVQKVEDKIEEHPKSVVEKTHKQVDRNHQCPKIKTRV